ncbi:MAG: hypothetical protein V4686_01020 [Patescibacteria group bacterium]
MSNPKLPYSASLDSLIEQTAAYALSTAAIAQTSGHVCIAMCTTPNCEGYEMLRNLGKIPEEIALHIQNLQEHQQRLKIQNPPAQSKPFKQIFASARVIAHGYRADEIHTGHVLLCLFTNYACIASQSLRVHGVTEKALHEQLTTLQQASTAVMA